MVCDQSGKMRPLKCHDDHGKEFKDSYKTGSMRIGVAFPA